MASRKVFAFSLAALLSLTLVACIDTEESIAGSNPLADSAISISGAEQGSVDSASRTITIPASAVVDDSIKIDSLGLPDGYSAYVIVGEDFDDPEIDWDASVEPGGKVPVPDSGSIGVAILDEKNCVVEVWKIVVERAVSSSSKAMSSSSKKKDSDEKSSSSKAESSDSEEPEASSASKDGSDKNDSADTEKSSSSFVASSSSKGEKKDDKKGEESAESSSSKAQELTSSSKKDNPVVGSSSATAPESSDATVSSSSAVLSSSSSLNTSSSAPLMEESSSSEVASSSSSAVVESSSSDALPQAVLLSDFSVRNGQVTVSGNKVFVELPYGTNLRKLKVLPMDTVADLTRPVKMTFVDELGIEAEYEVVAGAQLPGTDFGDRDASGFWATTSDAMANTVTEASIKLSAGANVEFSASTATLTTKVVEGSFIGIGGSWKMAGAFYFAGSYSGSSVVDIYQQGYTSGTPNLNASNISKDMSFGKAFMARPSGFDVTYSYSHENNENSSYPQKCLIYVMLVSADNKIVAAGYVSNDESKEMGLVHVDLKYGNDAGILDAGFAVAEGLTVGSGKEDVAYIHVMFASSAYAFVVDGGMSGNSGKYRGGENSALVLDSFKLTY